MNDLLILKRVELQGFKSFCDRTEMRFSGRGLAAIVGPNGCGKSNLSDAISWVLGEQSAKSLRGSKMEDVIFTGTDSRKPLGMAQVSLVMLDPTGEVVIPGARPDGVKEYLKALKTKEEEASSGGEGETNGHANGHTNGHTAEPANPTQIHIPNAPAPGKEREIIITRRLFRSGESEYLINGKHSRLRDIQELFMGTGLGPESYAIIEQGRIGQILSSKPLDRRAIIEEAAGISKFKTKRRLAEAKLEGAKQNLTRVFDILEEVSRQVNSLKRQASKARRYEELKGELDAHLRAALTGRHLLLEREAARVAVELSQAAHAFGELTETVKAGDEAVKQARERFYQTEADLTAARKRLSETELEAERTRGQIEAQARQIAGFETRLNQGEDESAQLASRNTQLEQERAQLAETLSALEAQAGEARQRLNDKSAERDQLQQQLREQEQALEAARQSAVRLLGEASSLRNQLTQIETHLAALERDTARITADEQSASADLERLNAAREGFAATLATRQQETETLAAQRRGAESELQGQRNSLTETRRQLEGLRTEASRLRARRDSLEEILSHRAYTTESVKRLFTAVEHNQAPGLAPAGVLADFVELTDPRFEKAAEEFLHEELEYVVVRDWEQARRGLDFLRGDLDGRATFLVEPGLDPDPGAFAPTPQPEPAIGPETGIAGRLSDGIRFTNGLTHAPAALLPRLARCYLAESREAAQRLSLQYPDVYFLLADGVCYHGHAITGGRKTGTGPLALKRELRELTALCNDRQTALAAAQARVEELETSIAALTESLDRLRAEQQRQEKETLVLDQELRKTKEDLNRAQQRLTVSRSELERIARDQAASREQQTAKLALVEEKEGQRAQFEASLEAARAGIEQLRAAAAHLGEEHAVLRAELAGLEERRRGSETAAQRLQHQIGEVQRRQSELAAEMERIGVQRARLLELNMELDQKAGVFTSEIEALQARVAELAASEHEQRENLQSADEELARLRTDAAAAQEMRTTVELELVRRQSELKFLDETCRKELGAPVTELAAARDETLPFPDELSVADEEEKAAELRRRIEALGPVNPEALTEYQESQQRYDFLNTQRQDLIDSIRDTEKAIHEIDTESRRRFTEAFHAINHNFKKMFSTLFGGGSGEMRLTGEGDALDQGIEIAAQPPGKRLQNVLLLSGGEKALTATALLMAIFEYQPSPFCILDEVDAPLDEANVVRLINLLKEMSGNTQFIVITHAKKTMESAQELYGVTMQERGVSKLVSVRLQPPPAPPANLQPIGAHA
ncbi:MAG: chromosome segregation protein SMC [Bryobacteraceae bacterium]|nr:chromosome segregation protein SMC [Bryobacteraceae bacterium]